MEMAAVRKRREKWGRVVNRFKRGMLYGVSDIVRNSLGMGTHSDRLRKREFWAVDDVSFEVKRIGLKPYGCLGQE